MTVSELMTRLFELQQMFGDVEVVVTNGFDARCYRGEYQLAPLKDHDGKIIIDIGIGGCSEID